MIDMEPQPGFDLANSVSRASLGDLRAFELLVRRYHRLAFGYALSLLRDYHLAEDAIQESFVEAFQTIRQLRTPFAFPKWLRLIVFKQCDRIGRRKRHTEVFFDDKYEGPYESPAATTERKDTEACVREAVQTLPPKLRLVTELFYINGRSQSDISQFLGVQASTVRKRLYDSRARLRKELVMVNDHDMDRVIRSQFGNRVAPDLLDRVLSNPNLLDLNGEERNLTVLFADGIDITAKQRTMEIRKFFSYMNEHFAILFDIIVSNGGFVDKIIGDEFMALWGTPVNPKDHAIRACMAAIDMQAKLKSLPGTPPYRISIGINTGDALIGNFGPPKYLQYTPLGDTINLGSRLEREARNYGVYSVIGEETYRLAADEIIARKLDDIDVRYQEERVAIYELIERKRSGIPDQVKKTLDSFTRGLDFFHEVDYPSARAEFLTALQSSGGTDVPSLIYLQRCAEQLRTG